MMPPIERYARWIIQHAQLVLLGIIAITLAAGLTLFDFDTGKLRLSINPSVADLLPEQDSRQQAYTEAQRIFGRDSGLVLATRPAEGVFSTGHLAKTASITRKITALPGVHSVFSLSTVNFPELDDPTTAKPADIGNAVLTNPLYRGTLVSDDGLSSALLVQFKTDDSAAQKTLTQQIAALAQQTWSAADDTIWFTGPAAVQIALNETTTSTLTVIIPSISVLVLVFLALAFRHIRGVLLPLIVILTALVWTLATIALFDKPLNVITAITPPLIVTFGLAYVMHVMAEYNAHRNTTLDIASQVRRTLIHVSLPLLITGITTAAGFLSLMLNPLPAVRDFALSAAIGVGYTAILSITLLPALLRLFGCKNLPSSPGDSLFTSAANRLATFVTKHRRAILLGGIAIILLGILGANYVQVSSTYITGFPANAKIRTDYEAINRHFGGANPLSIVINGQVNDTFVDPANLQAVEKFQSWLETQPQIGDVVSLIDYVKLLNQVAQSEPGQRAPDEYHIPDNRPLIKQLLVFAGGETVERFTDSSFQQLKIHVRLYTDKSAEIAPLLNKINEQLRTLPAPMQGTITGQAVIMAGALDSISDGQIESLGIALIVVFLILSALFSSFRTGLIALIPTLIPISAYFGLLGLLQIPLSPTTSLIACIVLGIAVDDTLHYLTRFNTDARSSGSEKRAVRSALNGVIRPITFTTFALCMGFLVLTSAGLQHLIHFGALGAFTIFVAWLADLFFTPALGASVRVVTLWDILRLDLGYAPHRSIPLFSGLNIRQARVFALLTRFKQVEKNHMLMQQGSRSDKAYVVIDGELEIWLNNHGQHTTLARVTRGAVIGETGLFGQDRIANASAISDSRVLEFNIDDLNRLGKRYPWIATKVLHNLNKMQADWQARTLKMLQTPPASQDTNTPTSPSLTQIIERLFQ